MANIPKRLRFEVLRRDKFACRYCGKTPPEVKLEVDAVIPESLGGSHADGANLVTACEACNRGKGSSTLDAPVVIPDADGPALALSLALKEAQQERADLIDFLLDFFPADARSAAEASMLEDEPPPTPKQHNQRQLEHCLDSMTGDLRYLRDGVTDLLHSLPSDAGTEAMMQATRELHTLGRPCTDSAVIDLAVEIATGLFDYRTVDF